MKHLAINFIPNDTISEGEDERIRLRYIGCRRESSSRNSDERIDAELISDGCRKRFKNYSSLQFLFKHDQ